MINIDQYEYILIAHRVYRKNISEIERETGHDLKTIRKVLNGEYSINNSYQHQQAHCLWNGPGFDCSGVWYESGGRNTSFDNVAFGLRVNGVKDKGHIAERLKKT